MVDFIVSFDFDNFSCSINVENKEVNDVLLVFLLCDSCSVRYDKVFVKVFLNQRILIKMLTHSQLPSRTIGDWLFAFRRVVDSCVKSTSSGLFLGLFYNLGSLGSVFLWFCFFGRKRSSGLLGSSYFG